jgi:predicted transcriptional regulator of viral defense system
MIADDPVRIAQNIVRDHGTQRVVEGVGGGAALSHQSAAELFGLIDAPSSLVHVTVPVGRRVRGVALQPGA